MTDLTEAQQALVKTAMFVCPTCECAEGNVYPAAELALNNGKVSCEICWDAADSSPAEYFTDLPAFDPFTAAFATPSKAMGKR